MINLGDLSSPYDRHKQRESNGINSKEWKGHRVNQKKKMKQRYDVIEILNKIERKISA